LQEKSFVEKFLLQLCQYYFRVSGGNRILEALHNDPAALVGTTTEKERSVREIKWPVK
jgi:hypothetical protein